MPRININEGRVFGDNSFRFFGPWTSPNDKTFTSYNEMEKANQINHKYPFPYSGWSSERDYTGIGPKGWKRSDELILEEVSKVLYLSPGVDASDIEVAVLNGQVTLSGTVTSRAEKKEAERLIEFLPGIWDVHNHLVIRSLA